MKILTKEEFFQRKTSDTLAIMGCGYSINHIPKEQWAVITYLCDQFGMNWYCNLMRDTTFYLIREQCVSPKKLEPGSMIDDLLRMVNGIKTTLIVKRKYGKADNYSHVENLDKFTNDGIVVNELPGKCGPDVFKEDIFAEGVHHGKCTMWDALHFAVFMDYKRIVFCGVDLYDFRYFWLPYEQTRDIVAAEGLTCASPHNQADQTIEIVRRMRETFPDIELFVQNPKSLLATVIPVWNP